MSILKRIIEANPDGELLKADGFDDAVIGITTQGVLVYSVQKEINILVEKHSMWYPEAVDFFYYNVECAFVGEKTPIWVNDEI